MCVCVCSSRWLLDSLDLSRAHTLECALFNPGVIGELARRLTQRIERANVLFSAFWSLRSRPQIYCRPSAQIQAIRISLPLIYFPSLASRRPHPARLVSMLAVHEHFPCERIRNISIVLRANSQGCPKHWLDRRPSQLSHFAQHIVLEISLSEPKL